MNKDTKIQLIAKSLLHLSILTKENTLKEALEYLNKTDEEHINNKIKYASILEISEEGLEWLIRKFYTLFKKKTVDEIYSFYKEEFNKLRMDDKLEFFKKYLTPSKDEVKLFGEVFTPIPLIEEMLDKLPEEVWTNPDLKWLDPANGIGNFPIVIYQRLMIGLENEIKDPEDRKRHILESMLYMVDISSKNTFICMNIFDPENKYKLNIYRGDFLNSDMNEVFGVEKFDVIVGNPPYQGKKLGGGAGSGNAIWHKFVVKVFSVLNKNKYLCFIHPIDWRISINKKKIKKAQNELFNKQIIYLKTGLAPFNAGAFVDWYVIKNCNINSNTEIDFIDCKRHIRLSSNIYPLYSYNNLITENIIHKILTDEYNGLNFRKSFGGLTILNKNYKKAEYKFAHGSQYVKDKWKYFEYPHINHFKQKVIMSAVRQFRPFYDDGNIGIGDHVHYILVKNKNEADFLISIINSKLSTFLQKIFSTTFWDGKDSHWNNPYPISKIKLYNKVLENDTEIYKHFNLTQEEIDYIENAVR